MPIDRGLLVLCRALAVAIAAALVGFVAAAVGWRPACALAGFFALAGCLVWRCRQLWRGAPCGSGNAGRDADRAARKPDAAPAPSIALRSYTPARAPRIVASGSTAVRILATPVAPKRQVRRRVPNRKPRIVLH